MSWQWWLSYCAKASFDFKGSAGDEGGGGGSEKEHGVGMGHSRFKLP
ncbi:MAG: hypothetical protein ACJAT5_000192 [Lentimonas sp.]|jgi:hypothetical protein